MSSPADALGKFLEVLDRMEIPYEVGGSVASSFHGVPRMTMDVDLVVDLKREQAEEFASLLDSEFYADAEMIHDALARGRAFNVIHFASTYKLDVFPLRSDEYSRAEFARRRPAKIGVLGPEAIECIVATAEDTMLRKLEWYRAGGETSERQWADLRGILNVSGARLDLTYLHKWAQFLKVADLLERLLSE
jgi:hypothetical protein